MSVEGLHTQVDNLQDEKLGNDKWFNRDTAMEDLANRSIETFQKSLMEINDEQTKLEGLHRLIEFLNSLGGDLDESDIQDLLEVLTPQDTIENYSLDNGRLALGADGIDISKTIMSDILYNPEYLVGMSKEDILKSLWGDMKYTQGGKGWNMISPQEQEDLNQKTQEIYQALGSLGFSPEEIDAYMIFGPKLLSDISSRELQSDFSNPEHKQHILEGLETQEEKIYFLRLWDFVNANDEIKRELLSENNTFANNLRRFGIEDFMLYLDVPSFSESPEVQEKKNEIFDFLSGNLEGEELEQMLSVYSVYLEYAGESSVDVDNYLAKLNDFHDMLDDEFGSNFSIGKFIERLTRYLPKGVSKYIGFLRRIKEGILNNPLESAIFAASFCPYAGDVIDIGYGAYKYLNGENLSGDKVGSADAIIQSTFGIVGLGLNFLFPGSGSIIKTLKTMPEAQIIQHIAKQIQEFLPGVKEIFENTGKSMLEKIKDIKTYFLENILPVIRGKLRELYQEFS